MNLHSGLRTKIAKVTFSIWLKTIVQLLLPQITTLCDRFVSFALYLPVPDLTVPPAYLIFLNFLQKLLFEHFKKICDGFKVLRRTLLGKS